MEAFEQREHHDTPLDSVGNTDYWNVEALMS